MAWDLTKVPKFEYNWHFTATSTRMTTRTARVMYVCAYCFLVYTNIWWRDLLTCSNTPCICTCYICMRVRVLRAQEQLATRSSCRNVMSWRSVRAVRAPHTGRISLLGIYIYIYISIYLYIHITVRISPFVALTISLIVYAAENASAPLAQCWFLCATYHDCAIFKRRIECNQFTRD